MLNNHFLLFSMLNTVVLLNIFVETYTEVICNIINVTFDQLNASLLIESTHFFK